MPSKICKYYWELLKTASFINNFLFYILFYIIKYHVQKLN
jgi:hypothetical protein